VTDDEADQVFEALNHWWPAKEPLGDVARIGWGPRLARMNYGQVMWALEELLPIHHWRPSMAKIVEKIQEGRKRKALADAKREPLALPEAPPMTAERVAELEAALPPKLRSTLSSIKDSTRPERLDNMARTEPMRAAGRVGERRRWGALALDVLTEQAMAEALDEYDGKATPACDFLDRVARRVRG
jgi:hypothetical protein